MEPNPIQKLSESLKTTRDKLKEIVAHTLSDDKVPLSDILDDLYTANYLIGDIHAIYQKIGEEKQDALKKLIESENWETTQSEYDLKKLRLGVRVFAPNESCKYPKGKHWLCANCFENRQKSILQLQKGISGRVGLSAAFTPFLLCPRCQIKMDIDSEDFQDYNSA